MHKSSAVNFTFAVNRVKKIASPRNALIALRPIENSTQCSLFIDYQFQMSHAFNLCYNFHLYLCVCVYVVVVLLSGIFV